MRLPQRPTLRRLGLLGERLAAEHYQSAGAAILGMNVRNAGGEIDVLAVDGDTLVAVEVKTRHCGPAGSIPRTGLPAEAVDQERLLRLQNALALEASRRSGIPRRLRIDIAEVLLDSQDAKPSIRILKNVTR